VKYTYKLTGTIWPILC